MPEVKNRATGEVYTGKSIGSVVRRVWGRRAYPLAQHSTAFDPPGFILNIVRPSGRGGGTHEVLGTAWVRAEDWYAEPQEEETA